MFEMIFLLCVIFIPLFNIIDLQCFLEEFHTKQNKNHLMCILLFSDCFEV